MENEIVDLKLDIEFVDKIHHVADIHIRNYKRHEEYRKVFTKLYDSIRENKTENSLIVVAGDIAHSKSEMSPELVDMMSDFFVSLADIRPTIIIPGNHDTNLANHNRLDALTPVVKNIGHKNIRYIKDSGLYRVGNIVFSHFSVFSEVSEYIPASEIPNEYKKIALYHGTVDRSVTEFGYVLTNDKVTKHTFANFDIALLGDIHKTQKVSEYEIEEMVVENETELKKYLNAGWELVEEIEE